MKSRWLREERILPRTLFWNHLTFWSLKFLAWTAVFVIVNQFWVLFFKFEGGGWLKVVGGGGTADNAKRPSVDAPRRSRGASGRQAWNHAGAESRVQWETNYETSGGQVRNHADESIHIIQSVLEDKWRQVGQAWNHAGTESFCLCLCIRTSVVRGRGATTRSGRRRESLGKLLVWKRRSKMENLTSSIAVSVRAAAWSSSALAHKGTQEGSQRVVSHRCSRRQQRRGPQHARRVGRWRVKSCA